MRGDIEKIYPDKGFGDSGYFLSLYRFCRLGWSKIGRLCILSDRSNRADWHSRNRRFQ